MRQERLQQLLSKYHAHDLTEEERRELFHWYNMCLEDSETNAVDQEKVNDKLLALDERFLRREVKKSTLKRLSIAGVAASLAIASLITFHLLNKSNAGKDNLNVAITAPTEKAFLYYASGDSVLLTTNTLLQDSKEVENRIDISSYIGEHYQAGIEKAEWITIRTPRSGKIDFLLPDGSSVWLNSDSEISFPVDFKNDNRVVQLVGEAYFEVVKQVNIDQSRMSFVVNDKFQEIKVLGTKFNVTSYPEDSKSVTTLIEGSVAVTPKNGGQTLHMKPNEQIVMNAKTISKLPTIAEEATGWKEDLIILKQGTDFPELAKIIERRYDVKFVAQELPTGLELNGELQGNINLRELLDALELTTNIKFTIKGRSVMIDR